MPNTLSLNEANRICIEAEAAGSHAHWHMAHRGAYFVHVIDARGILTTISAVSDWDALKQPEVQP
jgi:hypothetical protein